MELGVADAFNKACALSSGDPGLLQLLREAANELRIGLECARLATLRRSITKGGEVDEEAVGDVKSACVHALEVSHVTPYPPQQPTNLGHIPL
jgi:hypothetical protein